MKKDNDIKTLFHMLDNEIIDVNKEQIEIKCNEILNYFLKIYADNDNKMLLDRVSINKYRTKFLQLLNESDINYPILPSFSTENGDIIWTDFIKILFQILNAIINDVNPQTRGLIFNINKIINSLNKPLRLRIDRINDK
ncbi:hypothetical protein [Spiroplasma endosymbiont of Labia minor]|uniref:hypothetical protein n=1 Tax=Spiroplasma endosymbiont of Labia minor TaxID=3066305 RepID=UPI0030D21E39